jgi:hypothetical protein
VNHRIRWGREGRARMETLKLTDQSVRGDG